MSITELTEQRANQLIIEAAKVFLPASPVTIVDLFAGRFDQIAKVFDAINQPGMHAVVFGERGVGKTSLANILQPYAHHILESEFVTSKVNCDSTDTFSAVWKKALRRVMYTNTKQTAGFTPAVIEEVKFLSEKLPDDATPDDVLSALISLPVKLVFIFDEFDRIPSATAHTFTDLIKAFSDYSVSATVILVGVSDTVDDLVSDHGSIERGLIQVYMPRMKSDELMQILSKGAEELGVQFEESVSNQIVRLAQGLPHFAHLIGLHTTRAALARRSQLICENDFVDGIDAAIVNAQHTVTRRYMDAIRSSRKDALFRQVLLACALTPKDELSFFQAKDVEKPLSTIMGREYEIAAFAAHLKKFCQDDRGPVLVQVGGRRRFRYRFKNPLLEPYVIMQGLHDGILDSATLEILIPH